MKHTKIRHVRAFHTQGGGADYHDQSSGHWIDDHISTPMAKYPEYRASRQSFGLNVLGTLVVEIEAESGVVGFAISTGGEPAAWIVEHHLARFVIGTDLTDQTIIGTIWDQMYLSTLFYGRKGLVLNAISCVDLALWDLLGKQRQEPVYHLLGGPVRDDLVFYATGSRPDLAKTMGFIGGKMPLHHGPSEGETGMRKNLDLLAEMRARTGPDFWLMYDCWMSLDLDYAVRLATTGGEYGLKWIEEALLPDDYWGAAELRKRVAPGVLVTTGEHEATRWGFRLLLEMQCADILQPDVGWCGGITELINIAAMADSHGVMIVPHGSSVYSYHFSITRHNSPFCEFLMMSPAADRVTPMFFPLLLDEPVPDQGQMKLSDAPGFGVRLNPECVLHAPSKRLK